MKRRSIVLFLGLAAIAGSVWVGHTVWGQTAAAPEKSYTITQSQLDKYVAEQVGKAVAAERGKTSQATDEQVLDPKNWHKAIFNKAEYVIYTGPGQLMFHHWVNPTATPDKTVPKTSKQ